VKEKEVRAMEEEFKREGGKISPSIRQEDGEKLRKEVKELKRLRSDLEEELKRKDRELTRKLIQEIREITRTLTKKEKYTIILEKKSVVSFDEAIDITDKIIRMYDAQKK
jgi:outer membrane protein